MYEQRRLLRLPPSIAVPGRASERTLRPVSYRGAHLRPDTPGFASF